jgi:hypothetical protein
VDRDDLQRAATVALFVFLTLALAVLAIIAIYGETLTRD